MLDVKLSVGVKESLELLEGIKLLTAVGVDVAADGKVDMADLPKLLPLLNQVNVLIEAGKGANQAIGEVKDLDQSELLLIGAKVWEILQQFKK